MVYQNVSESRLNLCETIAIHVVYFILVSKRVSQKGWLIILMFIVGYVYVMPYLSYGFPHVVEKYFIGVTT